MRLLEYQGKELFAKAGIPVPRGRVAASVDETVQIMREHPVPSVVKAQVLIGGRGKAGGIKFCTNADDVKEPAAAILGMTIKGEVAHRVLIEERVDIARELYLSITVDRASKRPIVIASAMGGMDIEEVAATNPEAIAKYCIDPADGYWPFIGRRVAKAAMMPPEVTAQFASVLGKLYALFFDVGAMLLEINPLAITRDGKLVASDAKVDIDDNGLIRHPELEAWRTDLPDHPLEQRARKTGLNYTYLSGKGGENVGVIGNGAGLVMGTMDAVRARRRRGDRFLRHRRRRESRRRAQCRGDRHRRSAGQSAVHQYFRRHHARRRSRARVARRARRRRTGSARNSSSD